MTKEHSENKGIQDSTTESAKDRLLKKARKIPHPGTVRVTIFENPRVPRMQKKDESQGNKDSSANHGCENDHETLQNTITKGE